MSMSSFICIIISIIGVSLLLKRELEPQRLCESKVVDCLKLGLQYLFNVLACWGRVAYTSSLITIYVSIGCPLFMNSSMHSLSDLFIIKRVAKSM